jgi:hypothetical protein
MFDKLIRMLLLGLLITLLSFSVFAAPGVPHQFYGDVIVDGSPAPDDLIIEARIGGDVYTASTRNGAYGFEPVFYVEDPNNDRDGETITFFIVVDDNLVEIMSRTFSNGAVTRINLVVSTDAPSSPSRSSRGSSSSPVVNDDGENVSVNNSVNNSGGLIIDSGSGNPDFCESEWVCSEWSECVDFEQRRICVDVNDCDVSNGPAVVRSCGLDGSDSATSGRGSGLTGLVAGIGDAATSWLGLIILAVVIGLLFFLVLFRKT